MTRSKECSSEVQDFQQNKETSSMTREELLLAIEVAIQNAPEDGDGSLTAINTLRQLAQEIQKQG